jgi:hypothetical protein
VHLFITKGKIDVNENRKIFPKYVSRPSKQAKKEGPGKETEFKEGVL